MAEPGRRACDVHDPGLEPRPADGNDNWDIYVATFTDADLGVSLTASPDPVAPGGRLVYTLRATGGGPDVGTGATLRLLLPAGTQFARAYGPAGPCTDASGPEGGVIVTCPVGDLGPGDAAEATVKVDVTAPAGTTLTAVAQVDSATPDSHGDDNAAPLDVTVA